MGTVAGYYILRMNVIRMLVSLPTTTVSIVRQTRRQISHQVLLHCSNRVQLRRRQQPCITLTQPALHALATTGGNGHIHRMQWMPFREITHMPLMQAGVFRQLDAVGNIQLAIGPGVEHRPAMGPARVRRHIARPVHRHSNQLSCAVHISHSVNGCHQAALSLLRSKRTRSSAPTPISLASQGGGADPITPRNLSNTSLAMPPSTTFIGYIPERTTFAAAGPPMDTTYITWQSLIRLARNAFLSSEKSAYNAAPTSTSCTVSTVTWYTRKRRQEPKWPSSFSPLLDATATRTELAGMLSRATGCGSCSLDASPHRIRTASFISGSPMLISSPSSSPSALPNPVFRSVTVTVCRLSSFSSPLMRRCRISSSLPTPTPGRIRAARAMRNAVSRFRFISLMGHPLSHQNQSSSSSSSSTTRVILR